MKNKTIKLVALLTVFSVAAVSCQKENLVPSTPAEVITDNQAVYIYQYEVNGIRSRITLHGETERINFFNRMLALAKEGFSVSFFDESKICQNLSKEKVTYSTEDKEKALKWMMEMTLAGYQVGITYDEETGMYNCTAIR
jgi:hypothetical protein